MLDHCYRAEVVNFLWFMSFFVIISQKVDTKLTLYRKLLLEALTLHGACVTERVGLS